jgi:hypothetical protein
MRTAGLLVFFLFSCAANPGVPEARLDVRIEADGAPVGMRPPRPLGDDGNFYVLGEDPAHPRVRYLDGQVALDASCAIRLGNKLNRKVPPAYVNGQPIGFC